MSSSPAAVGSRLARPLLDIPPRIRSVVLVMGLAGVVMVIVASLESAGGHRVETDKILHFGGYLTLALLFVVGLPWKLYVPGLLGLTLLGAAIEVLQPLQGRSFDVGDQVANMTGVAAGAGLGLLIRFVLAWARTEAAARDERRRTWTFGAGQMIFRQGDESTDLYVIRSGRIRITREEDGTSVELEEAREGDVIGDMGVIQGKPRYATATALVTSALYKVDAEMLRQACSESPLSVLVHTLARRLREANLRVRETELTRGPRRGAETRRPTDA